MTSSPWPSTPARAIVAPVEELQDVRDGLVLLQSRDARALTAYAVASSPTTTRSACSLAPATAATTRRTPTWMRFPCRRLGQRCGAASVAISAPACGRTGRSFVACLRGREVRDQAAEAIALSRHERRKCEITLAVIERPLVSLTSSPVPIGLRLRVHWVPKITPERSISKKCRWLTGWAFSITSETATCVSVSDVTAKPA
jgi:hypothetical protein